MFIFQAPTALYGLLFLPALIALFCYAAVKRRVALKAFGAGVGSGRISRKREAFGTCMAAMLIVLALSRPAWNEKRQNRTSTGRNVVYLLDVSRSMLAVDRHPNRLKNAKTAILDSLPSLAGSRVGLVLFAGSAEIRCPLTVDHDYFKMALRQADPQSVTAGGTRIAPALEKIVTKLLKYEDPSLLDIILITDGGDLVSGPDEITAAQQLDETGARLIVIGIGDPMGDSPIMIQNLENGQTEVLQHKGRPVASRLEKATLQQMVSGTRNGQFFDVGTAPLNLSFLIEEIMKEAPKLTRDHVSVQYEETFPLFLGAAFVIFLLCQRWRKP